MKYGKQNNFAFAYKKPVQQLRKFSAAPPPVQKSKRLPPPSGFPSARKNWSKVDGFWKQNGNQNYQKKERLGTEMIRGNIIEANDTMTLKRYRHPRPIGFWKLSDTVSGATLAYAGLTGVAEIMTVGTISQCLNNQGINKTLYEATTSYFEGNPYMSNTNAGLLGAVTRPKDDVIVWKSANMKLLFSMGAISNAHLDVYIMICKAPTALGPKELWDQSYLDTALASSASVIPNKTSSVAEVAGYPNNTLLWQTPRDAKTLKKFWKIGLHRAIKFEAASTFEWNLHININKILRREKIAGYLLSAKNTYAGTAKYQPGTIIVMTAVRGAQVVRDDTAGSSSYVTTATTEILYAGRTDCSFHGVPDSANRLSVVQAAQNIDSLASNATQKSFLIKWMLLRKL